LNDGNVTTQNHSTLTLDDVTVTGTVFDTLNGSAIQIDGGTTLKLDGVSITGGTINDFSTAASGSIIAGDIDITGSSTITNASLNHGDVTIENGQTLKLDQVTVNDTTITFAGSGTLEIDQPSTFSGKIAGISGSSDVLDLGGFDAAHDTVVASTGSGSYDSATNTTSLLVTDETTHQSTTLTLVGDYSGSSWTATSDGHGGADIVDPPAASPATVATGSSFEVASAASAEDVTFHSSTGSLILDNPSGFTGVISGFTGDGTLAGSDQIDLKGIDYHSSSFTESYDAADDTLSVSDGVQDATLHLTGIYQAANFSFTTDGHGGTIVYDPPVPSSAGSGAQPPAATTNGQGFVFNFASLPSSDAHLNDSASLTKAASTLNKINDEHSGSVFVTPDGHDAFTAQGIVKAQLHAGDFHFV
jgi:fibronectin-binding autotransporter adhesin